MDETIDEGLEEAPDEEHDESPEEGAEEASAEGEEEAEPEPLDEELAQALLLLAETPGLWLAPGPSHMGFQGDGFAFVAHGRSAWVQRLRLEKDRVEHTVNQVGAILGMRGLTEASWWLSKLSTPRKLTERLLELGLVPDDPPALTALTIRKKPAGEPEVEVRRVETLEENLQALEIDWECFDVPEEERELRRAEAKEGWSDVVGWARESTYLAYVDDEPVGFGRAVYTPNAALLLGGATLPDARGQGVYTALVHARWQEAVERRVPRVVVAAGRESRPILEQLGFERIGGIRLLRQTV